MSDHTTSPTQSEMSPSCSTSTALASVITAIATAPLATVIFVLVQIAVRKCHPKFTPGGAETWNLSRRGGAGVRGGAWGSPETEIASVVGGGGGGVPLSPFSGPTIHLQYNSPQGACSQKLVPMEQFDRQAVWSINTCMGANFCMYLYF